MKRIGEKKTEDELFQRLTCVVRVVDPSVFVG